ncbi:nitronate monooxygenase [Lampropedia puyangensis]|uniref:Nitronate monooxygenase n=1 Tax=Lampropedia puyangensis TaxID=1330072 RepID=A0A4S8F7Q9_9BURK|nr:nitronate monooxygenase [Lampropedia puyangensis]THU03653.1 nitronate monooxygenase [Lampropedia puyangensis]
MHPFFSQLGLRYPLIQAPMAGVQDYQLALAAAHAGALGSLPCAMLTPEALQTNLQALHDALGTNAAFNVNFFCHQEPSVSSDAQARWHAALAPEYQRMGLDSQQIPPLQAGRQPFSAEWAQRLAPFKPKVVSFHFGLPAAELIDTVKAWGAKVIASATTVEEGLWLQAHGADAVIAQGLEAGGHRGHFLSTDTSLQMGTFALVPQLADVLSIPVIAAGGIVDTRTVRAAMALGAAGVQVGTAFLLCPQALTSPLHRQALQSAAATHTALTRAFTGGAARGIVNHAMQRLQPHEAKIPAFPLASSSIGPLRSHAEAQGLADFTPLWSGQNNRQLPTQSAAWIVEQLGQAALSI